ncbi:hypothetical protein NP233_g4825 [Leucocoprinus birnbaumii]|uniref:ELYS-like domain-containing protein n=1 Tax=Leucocoprinus birnbaumii TaxID=56174 RepID=A0AAD5W0E4_9AGAR|nr:hypothetical protein NP233_g4825 [Leucocoprinus birnbaumii]
MHAFPRSSVIVLEDNLAISSLIPSTLVDQVDALLDAHRIDDAAALVDQRRIKLEGNLTVDPDEAEELEYAYQVIGFKCFSETLFEDAGRNLFNGKLDPRVLVSYFPDLRGSLFQGAEEVDVFAGVAERMPKARTIEELIRLNLVLNYSPHLSPDSPPTTELTRVLNDAAREMLLVFLEKSRKRANVERRDEDLRAEVKGVVDTVLAKLYVHFSRFSALSSLLPTSSSDSTNNLVLDELEPLFLSHSLLSPLSQLYKQYQQHEKLLALYASIVDAPDPSPTDASLSDPVTGIFDILSSTGAKNDRKTCIKWGLWMLQKGEVDRGMKLLVPPDSSRRRDKDKEKEADLELLEQIQSANEVAGRRYLEYLVLVKRHTDLALLQSPDLHTRLALSCIYDLLHFLQDDSVLKLWRAKALSYASPRPSGTRNTSPPPPSSTSSHTPASTDTQTQLPSPPPLSHKPSSYTNHPPQQSFLTYFSSTTPDSPSKRARLKAVFMLSGSGVYDAQRVLDHLASGGSVDGGTVEKVLALECAILYGKLGNHAQALESLVHTLCDGTSAEAYCILGGEVVSAKSALSIAESTSPATSSTSTRTISTELTLRDWYFGLFETQSSSTRAGKRNPNAAKSTPGLGLADVRAADASAPALLRQKSVKDDVKKALLTDLVGVYMRSSDSASGIERTTKLLNSQGVNLDVVDVKEQSWPILREAGYLVEEPDSDAEDDGNVLIDEKAAHLQTEEVVEKLASVAVSEKVPFEAGVTQQPAETVVNVHVDVAPDQGGDVARDVEISAEEDKEDLDQGGSESVPDADVGSTDEAEDVVVDDGVLFEGRSALGLILDGGAVDDDGDHTRHEDVGVTEDAEKVDENQNDVVKEAKEVAIEQDKEAEEESGDEKDETKQEDKRDEEREGSSKEACFQPSMIACSDHTALNQHSISHHFCCMAPATGTNRHKSRSTSDSSSESSGSSTSTTSSTARRKKRINSSSESESSDDDSDTSSSSSSSEEAPDAIQRVDDCVPSRATSSSSQEVPPASSSQSTRAPPGSQRSTSAFSASRQARIARLTSVIRESRGEMVAKENSDSSGDDSSGDESSGDESSSDEESGAEDSSSKSDSNSRSDPDPDVTAAVALRDEKQRANVSRATASPSEIYEKSRKSSNTSSESEDESAGAIRGERQRSEVSGVNRAAVSGTSTRHRTNVQPVKQRRPSRKQNNHNNNTRIDRQENRRHTAQSYQKQGAPSLLPQPPSLTSKQRKNQRRNERRGKKKERAIKKELTRLRGCERELLALRSSQLQSVDDMLPSSTPDSVKIMRRAREGQPAGTGNQSVMLRSDRPVAGGSVQVKEEPCSPSGSQLFNALGSPESEVEPLKLRRLEESATGFQFEIVVDMKDIGKRSRSDSVKVTHDSDDGHVVPTITKVAIALESSTEYRISVSGERPSKRSRSEPEAIISGTV